MGFAQSLDALLQDASTLLRDGVKFWGGVVDDASAGSLNLVTQAQNAVKLTQRGLELGWRLFDRGDPLPPTAYITDVAGSIIGKDKNVYLGTPLPDATVLKAGPLQQLGGAKALTMAPPTVLAGYFREAINVKISGSTGGAPASGETYLGVVFSGNVVFATVFVQVQ